MQPVAGGIHGGAVGNWNQMTSTVVLRRRSMQPVAGGIMAEHSRQPV